MAARLAFAEIFRAYSLFYLSVGGVAGLALFFVARPGRTFAPPLVSGKLFV